MLTTRILWHGIAALLLLAGELPATLPGELGGATKWEYCIVGAGPGGLQVGQLMRAEGWRYVILERSGGPGSFFEKFPIHRQLISLNKRYTGRKNPDFNFRHDWNSLLGSDVAPVTNRSKQRFPHADVLVQYLRSFAKEQEDAGTIVYGVNVQRIARDSGDLVLNVTMGDSHGVLRCAALVMATGVGLPNMPAALLANGWDKAIRYADMPSSSASSNYEEYEQFAGKRALVVGLGNAGLETADALASYAAYVHLIPGREGKIRTPLFAHETRYVGDIRMMRASIFDSYLLKSLDGGMNGKAISAESHKLAKCGAQWCVLPLDPSKQTILFYFHSKSLRARRLAEKLSLAGYVLGAMEPIPAKNAAVFASMPDQEEERFVQQSLQQEGRLGRGKISRNAIAELNGIYLNRSVANDEEMVLAISEELGRTETPYPLVYDIVVCATGWRHDTSIYAPSALPKIQPSAKFPVLTSEYEAVGVKNLYFAGVQGHGKDHRKAAGGFIHGFRYVARALVRLLAVKRGKPWPHLQLKLGNGSSVEKLAKTFLRRIDSASGPYQMVHVLGDGAVLSCDGGVIEAKYYEDVPLEYFNRKFEGKSRFFMVFGYGQQRQAYPNSINQGTLFHPMLWHYPGSCRRLAVASSGTSEENEIATPKDADGFPQVQFKELLALKESLHTEWDKSLAHQQVADFIRVRVHNAIDDGRVGLLRHGKDVHLRPSSISHFTGRWGRGEIDLLVKNVGKQPVTLRRIRVGQSAKGKANPQPTRNLQEVAIAELDALVLEPGEGKRMFSEEKERWEATRKGKAISRITVDCAFGIVQDWLIGERDGSPRASPTSWSSSSARVHMDL